ncbi:hypothetical protein H0H87_008586 [Tephrocybe sp. NHM501043]|nr:hypothetical protein H0H87_008586 [Tephrocybe sp. NHM501043]
MAHNYYQQPQYYQPQNIYQQLGAQQPQQHGGAQIQQHLGFVQGQQQQQTPSLVQQRLQSLQQRAAQTGYPFQQQAARSGPLQIQQRPPTVHPAQQQVVQYQPPPPPPPQQVQPLSLQYTYPQPSQQSISAPWPSPQQQQPASIPWSAQRRPLPQPRPGSTSPTRSRPLPAASPGPYSSKADVITAENSIPLKSPWTGLSNSSTKPSSSATEQSQRGRASPPKFVVASIDPSNIGSSINSSPSPPSSVSSLSQDSFSGSPTSPARPVASSGRTSPLKASSSFIPSSSSEKLKSELSRTDLKTVPKSLVPGQGCGPVWKRTLPDVLPPIQPTPPPDTGRQQAHLQIQQSQSQVQQRPQRTQPPQFQASHQQPVQKPPIQQQQNHHSRQPSQIAPPPPIPSHTKPKPKPPGTSTTASTAQPQRQWSYRSTQEEHDYSDEEEEEEEEEGEEDDEEEQTEYTTDSETESTSMSHDLGRPPPSPQYGIRDLPPHNTPPHPGPMPQPPSMIGGGGPRAITSSSSSWSSSGLSSATTGFGSGSGFQAGWTKQERGGQSMTMRFAAGDSASGSSSGSAIGLPRPPMMGMSGGGNQSTPTKQGYELNLDDTPPRRVLALQRGLGSSASSSLPAAQTTPQAQGRRELPNPAGRSQSQQAPTQPAQRRPHSQIYSPTTPTQQPSTPAVRPQSQIYRSPLKQEDNSAGSSQGLQRSRSLGRGRELPKAPGQGQLQEVQLPRHPQPREQLHQRQQHQKQQQQFQQQYQPQLQRQPQPGFSPSIPSISIESPAPVGGRDRRMDIEKMESESDHEREHVVHSPVPVPLINIHPEGDEDSEEEDMGPRINVQGVPQINIEGMPQISVQAPQINIQEAPQVKAQGAPRINVNGAAESPKVKVYEVPGVSVSGPGGGGGRGPVQREGSGSTTSGSSSHIGPRRGGLTCGGCGEGIVGRIVNAMGLRWHPGCFRCAVCDELLEHVSSYEWEGRAYCHLDYHENFAPKCYSCKTPIYEERFISLDDPALGKRAYHEQHFFCAECGDPFLAPSIGEPTSRTGELTVSGDGEFASDDVGFTVYRGHPYCEACHVRLRLPKCKRCKRSIRDGDQAVEALGGKWCWSCFVCKV